MHRRTCSGSESACISFPTCDAFDLTLRQQRATIRVRFSRSWSSEFVSLFPAFSWGLCRLGRLAERIMGLAIVLSLCAGVDNAGTGQMVAAVAVEWGLNSSSSRVRSGKDWAALWCVWDGCHPNWRFIAPCLMEYSWISVYLLHTVSGPMPTKPSSESCRGDGLGIGICTGLAARGTW